ncbi:MAG: hypothetical protein WCJ35_15030 [Planctomycetota bacterium]
MNDLLTNAQDLRNRAIAQQEKTSKPPAPKVPGLTAMQQAAMEKAEHQADLIRDVAFAALIAGSVPFGKEVGGSGFKLYLDKLRRESGDPSDPIERMMVEQIAMAHFRIGQLHARAESAKTSEESKIFLGAAARLTSEFRRLALALKQYREPNGKRQFTVVRQQNVSAAGQQIAYVAQNNSSHKNVLSDDSKLTSKRLDYAPQGTPFPELQTSGSRTTEPIVARTVDAGGARTAAADGPPEPALEALNGTEDREGQSQISGQRSLAADG